MHWSRRPTCHPIDFFDERVHEPPAPEEQKYEQGNEKKKQNAAAVCRLLSKKCN